MQTGREKLQKDISLHQTSRMAAAENFMRLQQHQEDYLKWLEASERRPDMDRYNYKKIR